MIYSAIVIDNSSFFTSGTIRVRIQNYFYGTMKWDLSKDTSAITDGYDEKTKKHKDFDAYVFSSIGGGKNYGAFYLPEPNTKGFVAFTGNAIERGNNCFWMGSVFEPVMKDKSLDSINIPSDKVSANGVNSDGFVNGDVNSEVYDGALVIRLKSTSLQYDAGQANPKSDPLNWEKSNTENLIVINKNKVLIHHASSYDDTQKELTFQEITLSPTDTTITISTKKDAGSKVKTATLHLLNDTEFGYSLSMSDPEKKISSIVSALDGVLTINNTIDKNKATITQTENLMMLTYNDTSISLDADVLISSKKGKVYVTGQEIHIGDGNQRVLTTTSAQGSSYNCDNGMVILASDKIFG